MSSGPVQKRCKMESDEKSQEEDESYFRCYADITIHEDMIADTVRTNTYRRAILKNYELFYGKVVADIGAGTGILSMFCVQAGAKRVYAVEASSMADQTKLVVKANGMQEKIQVIRGKVEVIELPEKVDIIVSEWMGYFLLFESMWKSVLLARDKWLKKDGILLPNSATLYLAPLSDPEELEERLGFWEDVEDTYKVKMDVLVPYARKCITDQVQVRCVLPENVYAHAAEIAHIDMKRAQVQDIENVKSDFCFQCFGENKIHGFVSWFKVDFPQNITLTTSPYSSETHWAQSIMYIDKPLSVKQDTEIKGTISLSPNQKFNRFLDIKLKYTKDNETQNNKCYVMS